MTPCDESPVSPQLQEKLAKRMTGSTRENRGAISNKAGELQRDTGRTTLEDRAGSGGQGFSRVQQPNIAQKHPTTKGELNESTKREVKAPPSSANLHSYLYLHLSNTPRHTVRTYIPRPIEENTSSAPHNSLRDSIRDKVQCSSDLVAPRSVLFPHPTLFLMIFSSSAPLQALHVN